jgi:hypothetical protein
MIKTGDVITAWTISIYVLTVAGGKSSTKDYLKHKLTTYLSNRCTPRYSWEY